MKRISQFMLLLFIGLQTSIIWCMVYDNRFFPLFQQPPITTYDRPSYFMILPFATTADDAVGPNETIIGIPEIFGKFNLSKLANSMVTAGCPNPIPSNLQRGDFPFCVNGKIQSQGIAFAYQQQIYPWLSAGISWFFMRVNSREEFCFMQAETDLVLSPGDVCEITQARRDAFCTIGLCGDFAKEIGVGDIDAYLRFGKRWDFALKFRHIDAGVSIGGLFPTGKKHDICMPASVPFGGNGHWGAYIAADAEFEVKEDIKLGLLLRLNKRFARTSCQRMPVCEEPVIFGVAVGEARVDPGITFNFSPYFYMENLRKGLGLGARYTLTTHRQDSWCDKRCNKCVPVNLACVEQTSAWGSDYVSLNVFYDFGKLKFDRGFSPIISLTWDVPMVLMVADLVPKTNRVTLGIEFNF